MAATNQHHAPSGDPVEHDALNFSGITWFAVILTATVLVSQIVVWGMYEWFDYRVTRSDAPRAAMADAATSPAIAEGQLVTGADRSPQPALLIDEPMRRREFFDAQREMRDHYGWIDQTMGTIRLPIERAKDLVLERGLPVRPAPPAAE